MWGARLPRMLLGLLVGAALGLAGAVVQALTRNPLGDPGLLGISSGAPFGIVVAVAATGMASLYGYLAVAFAGVAITALLTSLTSGVSLLDPAALNRYRFWAAGSLAGQDTGVVVRVLLHDLNQAGRYADHVIAMRDGAIVAEGAPAEVITPATVAEVFDLTCQVTTDPVSGTPLVIPIGRHHGTEPVSSRSQAV